MRDKFTKEEANEIMGMWNEKVFFYIGFVNGLNFKSLELTLHLLFSAAMNAEEFITNFISCSSPHSPTSNSVPASISKTFLGFFLSSDNKLVATKEIYGRIIFTRFRFQVSSAVKTR